MPRSKLSNWASRQRLSYIHDHLAKHGWINREALQSYFALERSLGSMDITAYQSEHGPLRKASAGETMKDGTVAVGYKLGGRLLYVATGQEVASGKRWDLLPQGGDSHAHWFDKVMSAYVADRGRDTAKAYFGLEWDKTVNAIVEGEPCDDRRGIWEDFG